MKRGSKKRLPSKPLEQKAPASPVPLPLAVGVAGCLVMVSQSVSAGPIFSFNSCGASGNLGPTQGNCDASYAGTTLDGNVTVSGGIQSWLANAGTYRFSATGAQGNSADPGFAGGRGARVVGEFVFDVDTLLQIAVGQAGSSDSGSGGGSGGGGGGSFIVSAADSPLLIAGGGGGTRTSVSQNGCDASTTTFGGTGSASLSTWDCGVKAAGEGFGGSVSGSSWGSAGAGFFSDGGFEYTADNGGKSWANGMLGGGNAQYQAFGGFGGGGAGNGSFGGGGGGGYSGGDGGRIAGGGGSFISTLAFNTAVFAGVGFGDGEISIELLSATDPGTPGTAVPSPATLGLLGIGLAALGLRTRRTKASAQRRQ